MKKIKYVFVALAAVIGLLLVTEQADAHHPEITAEADCSNGPTSVVVAHAEAWQTDSADHRYNDNIQIAYRIVGAATGATGANFIPVGNGKFLPANGYKFSLAFSVPSSAKQIVVRATALSSWGPNQEFQGDSDFREVTVDLPLNCNDVVETTTTAPTSNTVEKQTTTTITIASTTIPPADTIIRQPRFTG
jgi:hypothetical protein